MDSLRLLCANLAIIPHYKLALNTSCYLHSVTVWKQSDYLITENAINGFQSGRVHLRLEFLYNVPPTLISPLRL